MILWLGAIILAGYNFGIGGVFIAMGILIIADAMTVIKRAKAQEERQYIRDNNVIVRIDIAEHNGENIFLAYAPANNKFIVQSMTYDDLKSELIKKFEGKSIFVKTENDITPIYLSPASNYKDV